MPPTLQAPGAPEPLLLEGGHYVARSIIAAAQRCVNLYPERNPKDSPAPFTYYLTPGLTLLASAPDLSTWRGLILASNGSLYGVNGNTVYLILPSWGLTPLGKINDNLTTSVGLVENGLVLLIGNGTANGWAVSLANNAFAAITDPNFLGFTHAGYLDTFIVLNKPNSNQFYSSLSNITYAMLTATNNAFDPTYIAAKSGGPDNIAALIVMHNEIWLLGAQKVSEVWYNAGNAAFPFARSPGVFIEHGANAAYSPAKHDLAIFWLGLDKDGQNTVFKGSNYAARRISTPAIAAEFSKYATSSDAVGWTYKQQDHVFYVLSFPTANTTWVWDDSEELWHQRTYIDVNGAEMRHRGNCSAFANGTNVIGDYSNGALYSFDLNNFTDNMNPIVRRKGFAHRQFLGRRWSFPGFRADMELGDWAPPTKLNLSLRWSDDRGRTFGNPIVQQLAAGVDLGQARWSQLGLARDRVFELFWSDQVPTALQGAWLDPPPVMGGS